MKVIGITGGVGSGKSMILGLLKEMCSCRVIVTDEEAAKLREPGGALYTEMVYLLGDECVAADGSFIRERAAQKIFTDKVLLKKVNKLIHPAVKKVVLDEIEKERELNQIDYLFVESALLLSDGYDEICDEIWYIFVREEVRRKRLKASRGYTDEKITIILNNQKKDEALKDKCKWVIDNSDDANLTRQQIALILNK